MSLSRLEWKKGGGRGVGVVEVGGGVGGGVGVRSQCSGSVLYYYR